MIELYITLVAAVAPAIVLVVLLIDKDKMRPEPTGWLIGATALGVVSAIAVLIFGYVVAHPIEIESFSAALYDSFITAAIPEEVMKLLMLWIVSKKCKHFDEYFDGIVYAVCIGMGFAGFENILYLLGEDNWLIMGVSRALLAVPAHYFFAVIMGTFFSLGYFDRRNRKIYLTMALSVTVIAHGMYDFFCFSIALNEDLCLYMLVAFLICFRLIRKYARQLISSMLTLDSYGYPTKQ